MNFPARLLLLCLISICQLSLVWAEADPKSAPAPVPDFIRKMQEELKGPLTRDSIADPAVPKGEMIAITVDSKIFPGSEHSIKIYVPAQYTPDQPACLMVKLDGFGGTDGIVYDNLIAQRAIPVLIAIAISPGTIWKDPPGTKDRQAYRFDRSYEFDSMNDRLANFIIGEVLPAVETRKTKDGRPIHISPKGSDHGAYGGSTGGIAAFTLAWQRPDYFTRVFSMIGTFVALRGGNEYSALVRKTEPKPIRVFLEDGTTDMPTPVFGNWFEANQSLEASLTYAGYDVQHVWGEHGHDGKPGYTIFPDVLRWLWKDWPAPVKAGWSGNSMLKDILLPEEGWQLLGEGSGTVTALAANARGELFYGDATAHVVYKMDADGKPSPFAKEIPALVAAAFGPDGTLYGAAGETKEIVAIDSSGGMKTIARGIRAGGLVVSGDGAIYVTEPGEHSDQPGKLWLLRPNGEKKLIDEGLISPSGICLSPDKKMLFVAERSTKWIYSFMVEDDGTLLHKQPFYWLHLPDFPEESGATDLAMDTLGNLYAATHLGVQACDPNGRVRAILPLPTPGPSVHSLSFGGGKFDTLYATDGKRIFLRRMKAIGYLQSSPPMMKPPGGGG